MKKIIALMMVLATLMCLALTSNAATYRVKKGTPVIDGKLDAMYRDSTPIPLNNDPGSVGQGGNTDGGTKFVGDSDAYALWDDNYIYVYIAAWDNTLMDTDTISIAFNIGEFYMFNINFKSSDFGVSENDPAKFDLDNSLVVGGLNTEGGYLYVEARIAMTAEKKSAAIGSGKQFGFHWVYWNDIDGDGESENNSVSANFMRDNLYLSSNKATSTGNVMNDAGQDIYGSTGTATPPYTAEYIGSKDSETTKKNDGGNNNPQTSDGIAVVSAVALCAAAAAVILVKKKRG